MLLKTYYSTQYFIALSLCRNIKYCWKWSEIDNDYRYLKRWVNSINLQWFIVLHDLWINFHIDMLDKNYKYIKIIALLISSKYKIFRE